MSSVTDLDGNVCMDHIAVERALLNTTDKTDEEVLTWLQTHRGLCLSQKSHIAIVSSVFTGMRMDLWKAFLQSAAHPHGAKEKAGTACSGTGRPRTRPQRSP